MSTVNQEFSEALALLARTKEYSGSGTVALILFYVVLFVAVLIVPIVTGVSLGLPNVELKYNLQGTILQGHVNDVRFPHNQ
jgi:hypothetical protein